MPAVKDNRLFLVLTALLGSASGWPDAAMGKSARPNTELVRMDDRRLLPSYSYGDTRFRISNIDRLAARTPVEYELGDGQADLAGTKSLASDQPGVVARRGALLASQIVAQQQIPVSNPPAIQPQPSPATTRTNLGATQIRGPGRATTTTTASLPGIVCYSVTRTEPPTRLFVAEVDLSQPGLRVHAAPGGPDPDGPGPWQTTLMPPTQIALREGFDLVVNGDFYRVPPAPAPERTNAALRAASWSAVNGPAASAGITWSTSSIPRPCLVVNQSGQVAIQTLARPGADDWAVVAGNTLLVENGVAVTQENQTRHPRTAVGLDDHGKRLIILIADGRKPGIAVGLSYRELAQELIRLGCRQALNLDGGGSSLLALRDPASGTFNILNAPTDGRERPVANVLGISLGTR